MTFLRWRAPPLGGRLTIPSPAARRPDSGRTDGALVVGDDHRPQRSVSCPAFPAGDDLSSSPVYWYRAPPVSTSGPVRTTRNARRRRVRLAAPIAADPITSRPCRRTQKWPGIGPSPRIGSRADALDALPLLLEPSTASGVPLSLEPSACLDFDTSVTPRRHGAARPGAVRIAGVLAPVMQGRHAVLGGSAEAVRRPRRHL